MEFSSVEQAAKNFLNNGQSKEAIQVLENALNDKKDEYGLESEKFKQTMGELCDIYNDLAAEMLEQGNYQGAIIVLRKAEGIKVNNACRVKTLNSLACYYRQIGKARIAENYLIKALEIQCDQSNTHLNLCAVLSELGKHDEALLHAMQAVVILQNNIISMNKNPEVQVDPSVMGIAYFNLGVELEYLKKYEDAMSYYKRAQNFAAKKLPEDHPITRNANRAVKDLEKKRIKTE